MLTDTHTQRVLGLASQKGLLRASDLDAIDASGRADAPDRRRFAGEDWAWPVPPARVPGVRTRESGDRRHQGAASRVLPAHSAMPRGSHTPRLDYPPIKMVQFTGEAYSAGVEEAERDGVKLRVYGVAKTVADC